MTMTGLQVFDWLVTVVNFSVMFVLFRLVVIIPMQEAVKLREQRVSLRLKEIEEIARDAEKTKAEFQEKFGQVDQVVGELKATADRTLAQAKVRLDEKIAAEEKYLLSKAQAEATLVLHDAEVKARSRVAKDAVSRAERYLKDALDNQSHQKIVSAPVRKIGELSAS